MLYHSYLYFLKVNNDFNYILSSSLHFVIIKIINPKFFGLIEDNLNQVHPLFQTVFKTFLKDKEKLSMPFSYPIPTPNWKRRIILLNLSSEIPLVFETLKTSKNGFLSL